MTNDVWEGAFLSRYHGERARKTSQEGKRGTGGTLRALRHHSKERSLKRTNKRRRMENEKSNVGHGNGDFPDRA